MSPAHPHHGEPATRAGMRRDSKPRRLTARLLITAISGAVLVAGLSGVDGTYAMWRDQAVADAGTISSGTASLTASWTTGHDDADWQNLLPGEVVQQSLTLENTGDVPMELTATTPALTEGFELRALAGPCTQRSLPTTGLGETAQPLVSTEDLVTATVLESGAALEVCVEVAATDALTPSDHIRFDLRFDGSQNR